RLGGPPERGNGASRLDARPLERLAALGRDQLGVLVHRLREPLRDVIERRRARRDGQVPRLLEGLRRGGGRLLDVVGGRDRDLGDERVVERVLHLEGPVAGAPLTVHEVRTDGHRSVTTFSSWLFVVARRAARRR